MGLLDRIFGRSKKTEVAEAPAPTRCPHTILNAVWDSADDVGNEEKASSFTCPACDESFSPAAAAELRAGKA